MKSIKIGFSVRKVYQVSSGMSRGMGNEFRSKEPIRKVLAT